MGVWIRRTPELCFTNVTPGVTGMCIAVISTVYSKAGMNLPRERGSEKAGKDD